MTATNLVVRIEMRSLLKRNTVKTMLGFGFSWATGKLPFSLRRGSLLSIYNYLPITDVLQTSGQPTEEQLRAIALSGVATVINLAPHQAENALADEASLVKSLGMNYVHLPVDFRRPTEADFEQFCDVMAQFNKAPLWVHCAANMRVSAFVFRYRINVLNHPVQQARNDLDKIWEPFGVWRQFISKSNLL